MGNGGICTLGCTYRGCYSRSTRYPSRLTPVAKSLSKSRSPPTHCLPATQSIVSGILFLSLPLDPEPGARCQSVATLWGTTRNACVSEAADSSGQSGPSHKCGGYEERHRAEQEMQPSPFFLRQVGFVCFVDHCDNFYKQQFYHRYEMYSMRDLVNN